MDRLKVHKDASDDLLALARENPEWAAHIGALIVQLAQDPDLKSRLIEDDYGVPGIDGFNVRAIVEHQRAGRNLWRLKTWEPSSGDTIPYRLIYAFDHSNHDYFILGVLHRRIAYESGHPRVRQLLAVYSRLNIEPLP